MYEEKHLLAAIMFSDIVGYTALMGEKEEEAFRILRKNRNIQKQSIKKYGGIWLKEMGDGILARFDSALNAVLCAKDIQQQIHQDPSFQVRIGIHLGDITVENEDVFGDGVNIASRLQSIADPGAIFVSESVIRAIRSRDEIKYLPVGAVTLKNVSYPVGIFAIQGEGISLPSQQKIKELSSVHPGKSKKRRRLILFTMILLIGLGGWFIKKYILPSDDTSISSIAVLPLANLTGDEQQEYFVAGMQDALITELSKIGSIRTISRQSTLKFQGSTLSMREIARQLNVEAIVEGSVYKSGNNVRIQIQLIKARPEETHLLAQAYDRELSDILNMHREITQDIASKIQVRLTAGEQAHLEDKKQVVPEAYEAYLKGTFHWNKLTREDLDLAENYFNLAIEKDPDYTLAYVGMASIGVGRAQMGYEPWKEAALKTMRFMDKALEMDSSLSEVYFMNAAFNSWGFWDWETAEQLYRHALKKNPNYAIAHAYYAQHLCVLKRTEEGLRQNVVALELDPFNTLFKEIYGMDLLFAKKYKDARELLEGILENDPKSRIALTTLRSVYHQLGFYDQAFEMWKRTYPNDPEALAALEKGNSAGGYSKALQFLAELLIERSKTTFVTPWQIGTIYARAGMGEETLDWLEKAYDAHDPNMPYINIDPIFDYLRKEPRFQALIKKMNFPG
jgi:adenylate cyclase